MLVLGAPGKVWGQGLGDSQRWCCASWVLFKTLAAWIPRWTQTTRPFSTAPALGLLSSLLPGCRSPMPISPMFYSGSLK